MISNTLQSKSYLVDILGVSQLKSAPANERVSRYVHVHVGESVCDSQQCVSPSVYQCPVIGMWAEGQRARVITTAPGNQHKYSGYLRKESSGYGTRLEAVS